MQMCHRVNLAVRAALVRHAPQTAVALTVVAVTRDVPDLLENK